MGNREDLLAGAKRCLLEKGYLRTTARDIVAACGANLASIGYHFGSKEELLNAALFEALDEWGAELKQAFTPAGAESPSTVVARFERYWTRVIESFTTHRQMWLATFDMFAQMERVPQLRQALSDGMQDARFGWAALFQNIDATVDEKHASAVGSFYQALLTGVLVQWLIDPKRAPSARDLADALRTIAASVRED